jgi:4-amino-4-deoxy-L-arabinose transferase-like glycosyltransferase
MTQVAMQRRPRLAAALWPRMPHPRRAAAALVPPLAIFAIALALRLYGIGDKPLWLDEITTLSRSHLPFLALLTDSLSFHHLPSYFLLTSWMVRFGDTEFMLRLPSAVFGALACVVVFAIGRRLGGRNAGLAAALLMAVSPAQVQYGQEARSYALVTCLIALGLWGQLVLVRDFRRSAAPWRAPDANRAGWAAYVLGTAGALNVLSVALFWWLAANAAMLLLAWRDASVRRGLLRNWGIAQLVVAAVSAPWFAAMYVLVDGHMGSGLDWVPPITLHHLWSTLSSVYLLGITSLISFHIYPQPLPLLGAVIVALAVLGAYWLRRRREQIIVLGTAVVALPVCMLLISLHSSLWMPRYLLWGAAPFFVMAGLGVRGLPRPTQAAAAVALGLLGFINLLPYYRVETKPRWDLAAAELNLNLSDGDVVLVNDLAAVKIINLYLGRNSRAMYPAQWTMNPREAADDLAHGHQVWAIEGRVGQADVEGLYEFLERVAPLGPPSAWLQKGRDVTVLRYDPPLRAQPCAGQPGCERPDAFSAGRPPRRDE